MAKYICKNPDCGRVFEYCRGCHLLPVPHMRDGFCSKSCQTAYNQKIEEAQEMGTRVVLENDKGIETASEDE